MATLILSPLPVNGTAPHPAPDISAQLMEVTPQMASELLKNRPPNRPIKKSRVQQMVADMRSGRWYLNGESIILDADLRVLDGQHRLMAVAASGCTLSFLVACGVPQAAMATIDQGQRRSAADALTAAQMPRAKELAAVCRWVWRLEHESMRQVAVPLANPDLAPFVGGHPGLDTALAFGRPLRPIVPESLGAALFWHFSRLDAALANAYHSALVRGEGLAAGHPALAVRRRALEERGPLKHAQVVGRAAVMVLGWNCTKAQKPCPQGLSWRGERDAAVPFPRIL